MLFDEIIKSSGLYGEALQEIKVSMLFIKLHIFETKSVLILLIFRANNLTLLCSSPLYCMQYFIVFLKVMYDNYVSGHIGNIREEAQYPVCLYQSSDIEKLRSRVNRLENDVTTLMAENSQ